MSDSESVEVGSMRKKEVLVGKKQAEHLTVHSCQLGHSKAQAPALLPAEVRTQAGPQHAPDRPASDTQARRLGLGRWVSRRRKQRGSCQITWGMAPWQAPHSAPSKSLRTQVTRRAHLPPSQHSEAASSCAETAKPKFSPRGKNRSSPSTTRAATCFELRFPARTQPCRLIPERGTAEGAEQACRHSSWPSRGFGSVLIGNSRCCSETGEKSPHEAF